MSKGGPDSQAGRRRFDPGLPLQPFQRPHSLVKSVLFGTGAIMNGVSPEAFPARVYAETVLTQNFEDAKRHFLDALLDIHRAHTKMLARQDIITPGDERALIAALDGLDPHRGDATATGIARQFARKSRIRASAARRGCGVLPRSGSRSPWCGGKSEPRAR